MTESVIDSTFAKEILKDKIKIIWEGQNPVENTLYFGTRKKTMYQEEIEQLEGLLKEKWTSL